MVKALIVRRMPDNEKIADFRICTKEVHRKNFEGKIFESARKIMKETTQHHYL